MKTPPNKTTPLNKNKKIPITLNIDLNTDDYLLRFLHAGKNLQKYSRASDGLIFNIVSILLIILLLPFSGCVFSYPNQKNSPTLRYGEVIKIDFSLDLCPKEKENFDEIMFYSLEKSKPKMLNDELEFLSVMTYCNFSYHMVLRVNNKENYVLHSLKDLDNVMLLNFFLYEIQVPQSFTLELIEIIIANLEKKGCCVYLKTERGDNYHSSKLSLKYSKENAIQKFIETKQNEKYILHESKKLPLSSLVCNHNMYKKRDEYSYFSFPFYVYNNFSDSPVIGFDFGVAMRNKNRSLYGMSLYGLRTVNGYDTGIHVAGNYEAFGVNGISISLLSNIVEKDANGLQVGGLNYAQISTLQFGILNDVNKSNYIQLGVCNTALTSSRLQIGVINGILDEFKSFVQVGCANIYCIESCDKSTSPPFNLQLGIFNHASYGKRFCTEKYKKNSKSYCLQFGLLNKTQNGIWLPFFNFGF